MEHIGVDYITGVFMVVFSETIKLFALMTPPAVLSAFLSATRDYDRARKQATARKTSLAVFIIGLLLFLLGDRIFSAFGFTLDAFRIGAGLLLFLSAVSLMNDTPQKPSFTAEEEISVVPLAIPLCMGPASIGTVMVLGASAADGEALLIGAFSLFFASLGIYLILHYSDAMKKLFGKTGMAVLSKLTGLLLAAIAAQVVFTGLRSFLQ
ncbi:MAG: MarC family protein [Desulfovibrio sp.]|jgi:multiple antibiotic resistance protein|nr:MarC family protein [Desulfovibrio sp.]